MSSVATKNAPTAALWQGLTATTATRADLVFFALHRKSLVQNTAPRPDNGPDAFYDALRSSITPQEQAEREGLYAAIEETWSDD